VVHLRVIGLRAGTCARIVSAGTCWRHQRFEVVCGGAAGECRLTVVCRPSTRPALIAPLLALALLLLVPALARADCADQPMSRTFLPWLDAAWYETAPNGGLEAGGSGWTLAGGAAVVRDNDPYEDGTRALSLPAGASATTAPVCVDIAHPTIRFFARGGSGALVVTALFRDPLGLQDELPVGALTAGGDWTPSPVLAIVGNLLSSQVTFRFASTGDWRIDDVYVDPYSKG
jgi:hypothetical protein